MLAEIKSLRQHHEKQGIIMSFAGAFSQGIIEETGEALKIYIQQQEEEKDLIPKVFSVFIEMAQNIRNYVNSKSENPVKYSMINSSSIVVIGKLENKYYLNSANLIENTDVAALEQRLEKIIKLDKNELKALYKDTLKNTPHDATTAGLGLIDMARKGSDQINYKFEKKDNEFSYFYLEVSI